MHGGEGAEAEDPFAPRAASGVSPQASTRGAGKMKKVVVYTPVITQLLSMQQQYQKVAVEFLAADTLHEEVWPALRDGG